MYEDAYIFYLFTSVTFVIMSNSDWLTLPVVILLYYGSQKPKFYVTSGMKTDNRHPLPIMLPLLLKLLSKLMQIVAGLPYLPEAYME
jgi:hypothetical protein